MPARTERAEALRSWWRDASPPEAASGRTGRRRRSSQSHTTSPKSPAERTGPTRSRATRRQPLTVTRGSPSPTRLNPAIRTIKPYMLPLPTGRAASMGQGASRHHKAARSWSKSFIITAMGRPRKPTPERFCQACGAKLERKVWSNGELEFLIHFNRRLYCDKECFRRRQIELKADPQWMTAHYHARKICPPGPCAACGSMGPTDVHHRDENWRNNHPSNLERLCRSCHMRLHRRSASAG
jgi:hypothetical protein